MAKATKTKTKKQTDKIDVPAVRTKPQSAEDMLANLTGATPVKKKKAGKERPNLPLTPEAQDVFERFIPAKRIFDMFSSHLDIVKTELNETLMGLWINTMFSQKAKPANPSLAVDKNGKPDMSGLFLVTAKFKVNATTPEEAQEMLEATGMSPEDADNLITNEIDFAPMSGIRSFYDLVKGHRGDGGWIEATEQEKEIAQKLMLFVMGQEVEPLTDAERDIVLINQPNIQVKSGFLDRVASYCKTEEELHGVFTVVKPVAYAKGGKFGISDTTAECQQRLAEMAAEILAEQLNAV